MKLGDWLDLMQQGNSAMDEVKQKHDRMLFGTFVHTVNPKYVREVRTGYRGVVRASYSGAEATYSKEPNDPLYRAFVEDGIIAPSQQAGVPEMDTRPFSVPATRPKVEWQEKPDPSFKIGKRAERKFRDEL